LEWAEFEARAVVNAFRADEPVLLAQSGTHNQADHAWVVGYAPFANPTIVVAVVVVHGGYRASAAAPAECATIAAYGPTKFNPHLCGGPALGPSNLRLGSALAVTARRWKVVW
jgi:Penicillin binding protein transpeptidase domain